MVLLAGMVVPCSDRPDVVEHEAAMAWLHPGVMAAKRVVGGTNSLPCTVYGIWRLSRVVVMGGW